MRTALPQLLAVCLISFYSANVNAVPAQEKSAVADVAETQSWSALKKLLAAGESPNAKQPDGMTALHWAVFHRSSEIVGSLIDAGAESDTSTEYSITPLSLGCEFGAEDCIKQLLKAGADANHQRDGKITPLMLAARHGSVANIEALVNAGAKLDAKERNGQTAMMWAAEAGNAAAVKALVDAGADKSIKVKSGFTAFLFAARQGHGDVVSVLLDAGVDVSDVMDPKQTGGRRPRKGMSALLLAIESGHFELALKLVERGADPNDQRSGFAPLHAVTWVRKTKVGDDPEGDPAPVGSGNVTSMEFIRTLIEAGADPNLQLAAGKSNGKAKRNPKGSTPFLMASATADIPMMKLLLEYNADPLLNNVDGCTPLMAAAGVGVVAVGEEPGTEEEVQQGIKLLSEIGVDVNAVDRNGETAMHGAAYRNFPGTVKVLHELGADPKVWNQKNKHGWTPVMIASGKRPGSFKPSPETIAAIESGLSGENSSE